MKTIHAKSNAQTNAKTGKSRMYNPETKEWFSSEGAAISIKSPEWISDCYKHLGFECVFSADEELDGNKYKCIVMHVYERDAIQATKRMRNFLRNFNNFDEELTPRNAWIAKNGIAVAPKEWEKEKLMWCISPTLKKIAEIPSGSNPYNN